MDPEPIEVVDAWCLWCGEPLAEKEERHPRRRYCSRRCKDDDRNARAREAWKAALETRACLHCSETVTQTRANQKFCSIRCQDNARYRRATGRPLRNMPKACLHCNEAFTPGNLAQLYCGTPCRVRAGLKRKG